jgi:uncharacterized protein (TIGR02757 family)
MPISVDKSVLEELYAKYNRREFIHPDPLEFLYDYPDLRDREIVGLVASSLAYGRVSQILKSVSSVLSRMPYPARYLRRASVGSLRGAFADFKHRFTTGEDLCFMLAGIKHVIERYGSLSTCFVMGLNEDHDTVIPALTAFVNELTAAGGRQNYLLPSPADGSACKRLNLFVRWMVRRDEVDPGGWEAVPTSKLIVPLDTHMHTICLALDITERKQADLRTAAEITAAFRTISPEDPVRYDFALTRLGIRKDAKIDSFLERCAIRKAA